ncbi:hypothetical protein KAR91_46000, partial [Candidatus Pacearchaeota archaeon]|nr:hypothetical protein [Candidatus Pacearchaeota archaeon]
MKILNLILALLISLMLTISCSQGEDAGEGGEEAVTPIEETLKSFTIDLEGVDNLIVQSAALPDESVSFASYGGGNLFYNKDGALFNIEIPSGFAVKKVHDVNGGSAPGLAISFYVDSTDDTTVSTCVLDVSGDCNLEQYEPRKMSGLGNSPFYNENNNKRRYLTSNNMVTVDMLTGIKTTIPFASNGQLSINNGNGHMIVFDGVNTILSASNDTVIPNTIADSTFGHGDSLYLNETKFYIPHKNGFLVKGKQFNDFYRLVDNNGVLEARMAQENAYNQYINVGGGFNRIWSHTGLSNCTSHIVRDDDDVMICGSKVYDLGDASNDIKEIDFIWAGHQAVHNQSSVLVLTDNNYLYYFSDSDVGNGKLTRIDLVNNEFLHVFSSPSTTYKINNS